MWADSVIKQRILAEPVKYLPFSVHEAPLRPTRAERSRDVRVHLILRGTGSPDIHPVR
jgi:hypothetical protein